MTILSALSALAYVEDYFVDVNEEAGFCVYTVTGRTETRYEGGQKLIDVIFTHNEISETSAMTVWQQGTELYGEW